jgi:hypothetical protein
MVGIRRVARKSPLRPPPNEWSEARALHGVLHAPSRWQGIRIVLVVHLHIRDQLLDVALLS